MSTTEKVTSAELADLPLFAGLEQSDLQSVSDRAVRRFLARQTDDAFFVDPALKGKGNLRA